MKSKENTPWSRLDNAAKIFPPTSGKRDPKVFRFSCELYEPVDSALLQEALEKTLVNFPGYKYVMRHGFFWYYLEESEKIPEVKAEKDAPCRPIYDRNRPDLLFSVTYFDRRISLEVYHALADGTGALHFLQHLTCRYLALAHKDELGETPVLPEYDASASEQLADSFQKYYGKERKRAMPARTAYKLHGMRLPENRIKVIEGIIPVPEMLALARSYHTTVTVFLTSLLLCAIHDGMSVREEKKPVVLSIPVNLRQFFPSESARNFFALMSISYSFDKNPKELEEVIPKVAQMFQESLTPEKLQSHMNSLVAIEKNLAARAVPLFIKDLSMRFAYWLSARGETAALSNVGKVSLPEPYLPYVRLFDVFTSADKIQICMCSFQDLMTIGFSDPFMSADVQKYFFRWLSAHGISVEIAATPGPEEWEEAREKKTFGKKSDKNENL